VCVRTQTADVWGQRQYLCRDIENLWGTDRSYVRTQKLCGDRDSSCVEIYRTCVGNQTEIVWGQRQLSCRDIQNLCGESDRSCVGTETVVV